MLRTPPGFHAGLRRPTGTILLTVALAAGRASELPVTENGVARAVIVQNSAGGSVTALAVQELRSHIEALSGVRLDVVPAVGWSPATGQTALVVGQGVALDALGVALGDLPAEGFRLLTRPRSRVVILAGRDSGRPLGRAAPCNRHQEFGSLYAVYALLERWGVRWFLPGEAGTVIPRTNRLAVAALDVADAPDFRMRNFWLGASVPHNWPSPAAWSARQRADYDAWERELRLWALRNRAGNADDRYHTRHHSPSWWSLWGTSHPEFLGLSGGVRGLASNPERSKLCVSNPDLARALAERAKTRFHNTPGRTSYSICEQDGSGGYCECAACQAWDAGTVSAWSGLPTLSDRYARFWNAVAADVAETFPDRRLGVYLYGRYADPPTAVGRLHPMVSPVAVFNDVVEMDRFREVIEGWGRVTSTPIALYTLPLPGAYGMNRFGYPWVSLRAFGEGMRAFHQWRVPGFRATNLALGDNGFATAPMLYLAGRLAWRASADPLVILDDFCLRLFGPAGIAMRDYFLELERIQRVRPELAPVEEAGTPAEREAAYAGESRVHPAFRLDYFLDFWSEERINGLRSRLERAASLAADNRARLAITRVSQALEFTALDTAATRACGRWHASQTTNDWALFRACAARRQAFLEALPPFAGVLDPGCLGNRAETRGYAIDLDDPDLVLRDDFGRGNAAGWRTRLAFDGVRAEPDAAGGYILRGRAEHTEILVDRNVPLRGGGPYRMALRWRAAAAGYGLRVRLVADGATVFNRVLLAAHAGVWHETAFTAVLPDGRDRVRLYLYLVAGEGAPTHAQADLDRIELRRLRE